MAVQEVVIGADVKRMAVVQRYSTNCSESEMQDIGSLRLGQVFQAVALHPSVSGKTIKISNAVAVWVFGGSRFEYFEGYSFPLWFVYN